MPNASDYSLPLNGSYQNQQIVRVSSALPAAGAWDQSVIQIPDFDKVVLLFEYTRGGAGGGFEIMLEASLDGVDYYSTSIYAGGAVVDNADSTSQVQREIIKYGSTAAAVERFLLGPVLTGGVFDYLRVSAREEGDVAHPGTLEIMAGLK